MLLLKDGLLELHYDVTLDVLSFNWPDLSGMTMPEIDFSLRRLVDTLRHYDIKHLLVDSRGSRMQDLTGEEHLNLMLTFTKYLMATRLQKMARIATTDMHRESVVDLAVDEAVYKLGIQFKFANFPDEQSAQAWLREV